MQEPALFLIVILLTLDIAALIIFLAAYLHRRRMQKKHAWSAEFLSKAFKTASKAEVRSLLKKYQEVFIQEYISLCDSILPDRAEREKFEEAINYLKLDVYYIRQLLGSRSRHRRSRAALYLGYFQRERCSKALIHALENEKHNPVMLYIIFSLGRLNETAAIPTVIDSLSGRDRMYQRKVWGLLEQFGSEILEYFEFMKDRKEKEIMLLFIHFAGLYRSFRFKSYLEDLCASPDREIARQAKTVLITHYLKMIEPLDFLYSDDPVVTNLTLEALGNYPGIETIDRLVPFLTQNISRKSASLALSHMLEKSPQLFNDIYGMFRHSGDTVIRERLLDILANHVEYLLGKLQDRSGDEIHSILSLLIRNKKTSGIIAFLNKNRTRKTERRIIRAIRPLLTEYPSFAEECSAYLKPALLNALGLLRKEPTRENKQERKEYIRRSLLITILLVVFAAAPGLYVIAQAADGSNPDLLQLINGYAYHYAVFFAFYAFILNFSYLLLLFISFFEIRRQHQYLSIKPLELLFSPGILPSISILVPAYCEEATIIESVNSLLNLRYPDYEIIVINDGSTDGTLEKLIDHFELERHDIAMQDYLKTRAVRGVYSNRRLPELVVIDKNNGGKADSLNAGINAARREYFAGIDSDSLLERDSLLDLTASFIDSDIEVIAAGGNILPVNGCTVRKGYIESIGLPKNNLARFQTIEYIRSFMAGRTAWAGIRALLIISGAFGVFKRKDVIGVRGYLTGSEIFTKDTVGEDMELVVRMSRRRREKKRPFRILYAFNANCWTEVPEKMKILKKQRDRWQRGLIDIITYHIKMVFNPSYGAVGTVGLPYFFFFEIVGPWLELLGYGVLIFSLVSASLPLEIFFILFAVTIPFGLVISFISLALAEWQNRYFSGKDKFLLLCFAFLENFGFRQFMSIFRIAGFIRSLGKKSGWGVMERKGFDGG